MAISEICSAWLVLTVLPADAPDLASAALRACELVLAGDPQIGKVTGSGQKHDQGQLGDLLIDD